MTTLFSENRKMNNDIYSILVSHALFLYFYGFENSIYYYYLNLNNLCRWHNDSTIAIFHII